MRKRSKGFIIFIMAIVALIVSLKMLNWVPGSIQEGLLGTYKTVDEVRSTLHVRDVYLPSYYPQGLRWPPTRILAQSRPYIAVMTEFTRHQDDRTALVIAQTTMPHPALKMRLEMISANERVHAPFKGRNGMLEAGLCGTNEPCSRISWSEPPYRLEVIMLSPPSEIMKIAESMVAD
jgi:hypothetical protein